MCVKVFESELKAQRDFFPTGVFPSHLHQNHLVSPSLTPQWRPLRVSSALADGFQRTEQKAFQSHLNATESGHFGWLFFPSVLLPSHSYRDNWFLSAWGWPQFHPCWPFTMAKQTAVFQDREDTHSNHFSFGFFQVQMGRSHFFFARVEHVIKICALILSKVFFKSKTIKVL